MRPTSPCAHAQSSDKVTGTLDLLHFGQLPKQHTGNSVNEQDDSCGAYERRQDAKVFDALANQKCPAKSENVTATF